MLDYLIAMLQNFAELTPKISLQVPRTVKVFKVHIESSSETMHNEKVTFRKYISNMTQTFITTRVCLCMYLFSFSFVLFRPLTKSFLFQL